MSITMKCFECKVTSLNGIMEHAETCSGHHKKPTYDYLRPPATEIIFSDPEERKKFMKAINGNRGV